MMDIVSPLLKLVPFIWEQLEKELRVLENAERNILSLEESIGVIERFLTKANSMEILTEDLKASVKRARKFLYAFEDAIDDFTRREGERNWEGFLADLFHHWKRRNFASGAGHILPMLDDYTTMERHAIMEALRGLSGNDAQSSSAGHLSSSVAYSEEIDKSLVGIRQSKGYLGGLLQDKKTPSPKVIFVHGARGVGKTSLVGAVLRNKDVELLFKYYVWIEDLGSCESSAAALMEANTKMWDLGSANKENPRDHKLKEAFRHMEEDRQVMNREKSWVLVMDDASIVDVFVALESHLNRTRPNVLVTTRVHSLQSSSKRFFKSMKAGYFTYEFECVLLTRTDSHNLFWKNIHRKNIHQKNIPRDVSKCILKKFNGLPLEILATCDLLNRRRPSATGALDCVKWKRLSGRLGDALLSNGYEGGPIRRMRAPRIDPLLDVRACLFYLSVFPLGCPINCSTMMRLWMAEGFIEQKGAQPVQEKAEETLERLLDHYEILEREKTSCGRVKTCGLPPIWHQQIISESVDEEFTMIVDRPERRWPENVWHLSIHGDMDITYDDRWVKQLRSLLIFKKVNLDLLKSLLMNAKRLKVLHLQSHLTEQEKNDRRLSPALRKIFKLKYLRYLSLRGSWVKEIPVRIKNLKYLETLDLRDTLVRELPKLKLKALRHLLISNRESNETAPLIESAQLSVKIKKGAQLKHKVIHIGRSFMNSLKGLLTNTNRKLGVQAPSNLGDLTSLQKLCMIEVESVRQEKWPNKLGKLINLQKLGLSKLKSTDWQPLCSSIEQLTNLEALHLIGDEGQKIEIPDKWKAPKSLQRVHLTGCLETLPDIFPHASLVKLVLKGSQLKEDPLRHLGKFSHLKHLELEEAFDFEEMEFTDRQFEKLCFLGLSNFGKLVSIQVPEEALRSLERLYIARCTKLTEVPEFITLRIRKFKRLEFCEMHDKFDEWARQLKSPAAPAAPADMTVKFLAWNVPTQVVEIVRGAERQGRPTLREHLEKSSP